MSYSESVESEILVLTGWLVDPNSIRGSSRRTVSDFLTPRQSATEGTGWTGMIDQ